MPATLANLLEGLGPNYPVHVLSAIARVPRHHFVAEVFSDQAYKDAALDIGHGVTASRPSTVATMLAALGEPAHVLEVGTGSGWQTALLSTFCRVRSIEINERLHERACRDLRGYCVALRHGNGLDGWPEAAPFDGIIVCCGVHMLRIGKLLDQLTDDGVMVAQLDGQLCRINKRGEVAPIGRDGRFPMAA